MENRDIVDKVNNCIVEGVVHTYKGYVLKHSLLKKHNYSIQTPSICIIATTVIFNVNPKLDYLYINILNTLDELLSIDVSVIQNPSVIFIPIDNTDVRLIIDDIKHKHPKHGFNEEPFQNPL